MSTIFNVTIGNRLVRCFAADSYEAVGRACEYLNSEFGLDLSPDTVTANVTVTSKADIEFNEEVLG